MADSYNPFSLKDKTILVTGASSGIGQATAIECSRLGADVIISGRNEERLRKTYSKLNKGGHSVVIADLTVKDEIEKLIHSIPLIHGIVLCAGIGNTILTQFASRKKIDLIFETNFFAQVEFMRMLQKKKKIYEGGSVVAISSIGGPFAINLGNGPYGASKSALLTWMKFLAQELAPRKIRVNCVCPGMVHTPLVDTEGTFSKEELESYKASIPFHRFGEPHEIALACVYLLSDASKWMTGTEMIIDGGTTLR